MEKVCSQLRINLVLTFLRLNDSSFSLGSIYIKFDQKPLTYKKNIFLRKKNKIINLIKIYIYNFWFIAQLQTVG